MEKKKYLVHGLALDDRFFSWKCWYSNQRWGQYFMNTFFPTQAFPELFYERNTGKAMQIIYDTFEIRY